MTISDDDKRWQLINTISKAVERYGKQRPTNDEIMRFVNGLLPIPVRLVPPLPPKPREPANNLIVIMEDGTIVKNNTAYKTFHKVLESVGIEKIAPILPQIVFLEKQRPSDVKIGRWYTRRYRAVFNMADLLARINDELKLKMRIEVFER